MFLCPFCPFLSFFVLSLFAFYWWRGTKRDVRPPDEFYLFSSWTDIFFWISLQLRESMKSIIIENWLKNIEIEHDFRNEQKKFELSCFLLPFDECKLGLYKIKLFSNKYQSIPEGCPPPLYLTHPLRSSPLKNFEIASLPHKAYTPWISENLSSPSGGGLNDLREDTMITKWEFGKSERTHPPPPT